MSLAPWFVADAVVRAVQLRERVQRVMEAVRALQRVEGPSLEDLRLQLPPFGFSSPQCVPWPPLKDWI